MSEAGVRLAPPSVRKWRAGDIAIELRRQIVSAHFQGGERLPPEREFAGSFGVSRGTVRDALRQLEESGFVERRPGSGTYVTYAKGDENLSITQATSPLELMDTRFALEPQIVRLAVLHANQQTLHKAEDALEAMESCGARADPFASADDVFHVALAECTQNSMLIWMVKRVSEVRNQPQWTRMRQLILSTGVIAEYNRQHREILEAIRNRDAERAATAMRRHLEAARRSLVDAASS